MSIRILHVLDKISVDSGVSSVVMNYYKSLDHDRILFDFMLNEDVDSETRKYIEDNGSVTLGFNEIVFLAENGKDEREAILKLAKSILEFDGKSSSLFCIVSTKFYNFFWYFYI